MPGTSLETPTPTGPPDDEAISLAEQTFRLYIDAQNQVVIDDPSTFEPLYALSTGRQNGFDRQQYSTWHAKGWRQSGDVRILWIDPVVEESTSSEIRLQACLDTTDSVVTDADGDVQRAQDGLDVAEWTVLIDSEGNSRWLVEVVALPENSQPCRAR